MSDSTAERWLPVPGFDGYEVSDLGNFRRVWPSSVTLQPVLIRRGYRQVSFCQEGVKKEFRAHQVVMQAFVGSVPEGMQVCHNNGNPADNRLENLRYGTPKENQQDRLRHGTECRGETHPAHKLKAADVREIRRLVKAGVRQARLAERYGVHICTISDIIHGRTWRHV